MQNAHPVLGPLLARGGMGSVHRATFRGGPVAVKVLAPEHASDAAFVRAFRTEARAMATLHHPNILAIHDLGRFHEGPWAGCPYVVMDLADGNLVEACGRSPWEQVCAWLEQVLAGLAHAHARGITHRDLKPQNLLRLQGRIAIADFGLARAFEAVDLGRHEQPAGTPGYMPDEQRLGRWRDIGPWTDLYALGKLALDLVADPAGGSVPVPVGFDRWVSRLRQPLPADRFRRAADALHALRSLPAEATETLGDLAGLGPLVDTELARTQPYFQDEDVLQPALPPPVDRAVPPPPANPLPTHAPPPARRPSLALLHQALPSGLDGPTRALWEEVRRAHAGERRIVRLLGPATGTLAFWLCHQLHETGAGSVELATHDVHQRPGTGLAGMLARELRCLDLEVHAAEDRLAGSIHRDDRRGLLAAMAPALGGTTALPGRDERFAIIDRFLERDAEGRLPFLWVQDAEHAVDALDFVSWRRSRGGRFLALVTGDVDVEADRTIPLAALPTWLQVVRLRSAVELADGARVSEDLVHRSGGDPVVALLLAAHPTARDADEAWSLHLRPFAARPQLDVLALGAVLGLEVEQARWLDMIRRAKFDEAGARAVLEHAFEQGVAIPVGLAGNAWRFASPRVREVVLRLCRSTRSDLHRLAAESYPAEPHTALVRAWHFRQAGDDARARKDLLAALPLLTARDPIAHRAVQEALTTPS